MAENREKPVERPQNKNLKRDAGPGRPPGQLNYATIYRNALIRLGKENNKTPEEIEEEMIANGALLARKGNYSFYKDILDRIHGPANTNEGSGSKTLILIVSGESANRFNVQST